MIISQPLINDFGKHSHVPAPHKAPIRIQDPSFTLTCFSQFFDLCNYVSKQNYITNKKFKIEDWDSLC